MGDSPFELGDPPLYGGNSRTNPFYSITSRLEVRFVWLIGNCRDASPPVGVNLRVRRADTQVCPHITVVPREPFVVWIKPNIHRDSVDVFFADGYFLLLGAPSSAHCWMSARRLR